MIPTNSINPKINILIRLLCYKESRIISKTYKDKENNERKDKIAKRYKLNKQT